jgi:hypothetical protein
LLAAARRAMDARQDQIAKGTDSLPEKTVEFTVSNRPAFLFESAPTFCVNNSADQALRTKRTEENRRRAESLANKLSRAGCLFSGD